MTYRFIVILIFILTPHTMLAGTYKASLAEMPVHAESLEKGVLVDLVQAIALEWDEEIDIGVYPFIRSMKNVIDEKADFHIPLIKNDLIPEGELPYSFSTETLFRVNFVLYTVKNREISLEDLANDQNLIIESDRAHIQYFPFQVEPSSNIASSLKKLSLGRIDAYIFSDVAADPVLIELGLTNIRRQFYKTFDVKIILPKNRQSIETDKALSEAIQSLRGKGRLNEILQPLEQAYDDWQPQSE